MTSLRMLIRAQAMYQLNGTAHETPLAFLYRVHITRGVRAMGC